MIRLRIVLMLITLFAGILRVIKMHVSPSQISLAKDCWRKWGFAYIEGRKTTLPAQLIGTLTHKRLENYLVHDQIPDPHETCKPTDDSKTFFIGEIALNAIERLPAKNSLLEILGVEKEFSFIVENIVFKGLIDLLWAYDNLDTIQIWDHKTSSNPRKWAKKKSDLLRDPQAIIYSFYVFKKYNWLQYLDFSLNYIDTNHNRDHYKLVTARLDRKHVSRTFFNEIMPVAEKIIRYKTCNYDVNKLQTNTNTCNAYGGCPYTKICKRGIRDIMRAALKQERIEKNG